MNIDANTYHSYRFQAHPIGSFLLYEDNEGELIVLKRIEDNKKGIPQAQQYIFSSVLNKNKVIHFINLRQSLDDFIKAQLTTVVHKYSKNILDIRSVLLNEEYDSFVKAYGHLNTVGNLRLLKEDPSYAKVCLFWGFVVEGACFNEAANSFLSISSQPRIGFFKRQALYNGA